MANATIVDALQAVVGSENAFPASDERARVHRSIFSFTRKPEAPFAAVALPKNAEELQGCARAAHAKGMALWITPNQAGNGATIDRTPGPAIVLDLSRMNRILEVNETAATVLLEPGVTFRQLHEYLKAHNLSLCIDCDRNPDNSVAGGILSRHYGYTPYADRVLMQCGMEVILRNGDVVRTGMGAVPKSDCWQTFKYNFGPYYDGLFAQSDLGIVSKIGLWLMPEAPVVKPFAIGVSGEEDLAAIVEAFRPLRIGQAIGTPLVISSRAFETAFAGGNGDGLDTWNVFGALYGIAENVDFVWGAVEAAASTIPQSALYSTEDGYQGRSWEKRQKLMSGIPLAEDIRFEHGGGYLELTVSVPAKGETVPELHRDTSRLIHTENMPYLTESKLLGRHLVQTVNIPYDPGSSDALQKALTVSEKLISLYSSKGRAIVHHSAILQPMVDRRYADTPLNDLVGRLRSGLIHA